MRACIKFASLGALLLMCAVIIPSGQPAPLQPGEFVLAAPSNLVSWQFKRLAPPSPLYITRDDVLRVVAESSAANEVVTVNYRLLRPFDSQIIVGQFAVNVPSIFPVSTQDQPLTEGFLLSVSCQASQAVTRGQTFVRLMLNPKALGAGQPGSMLMADYVTTAMAAGYPNGRIVSPVEGPGNVYARQFTSPARGHDWGQTGGLNARRRLIAVSASLVTSAAAGNRVPFLIVLDNLLNQVLAWTPPVTQAPSSGVGYQWSSAPMPSVAVSTTVQVPMPPDLILPVGYSIEVVTGGLDTNAATGDVWSKVFAYWEEWLDNV